MSSRPDVTPVAGISRSSRAPAATAPGPYAAPAIALSSGERFSPGTNVSANASRVMVLMAVSAEVSTFPPVQTGSIFPLGSVPLGPVGLLLLSCLTSGIRAGKQSVRRTPDLADATVDRCQALRRVGCLLSATSTWHLTKTRSE